MSFIIWSIIGVGILIIGWIISTYNRLIGLKNKTKGAWADIDVQLKRRYDLIPNLVNIVKGYAAHEKEVFEKVTEARTKALSAETPTEAGKAEKELAGTMKTLFAVAEAYPELRASENFQELQKDLSNIENQIQAARRFYNGNVRNFNIRQEQFPYNLIAKLFGFKKAEFFEIEEIEEKKATKTTF